MEKRLCFIIEHVNIYLEHVLVDYMDIPIFFLCKGKTGYFLALCTDVDEFNYIVVKLSESCVYNLLHGKIFMRDAFLRQSGYWEITTGNELYSDVVKKKDIKELNSDFLPEKNACYEVLTEDARNYVRKFDREFFSSVMPVEVR